MAKYRLRIVFENKDVEETEVRFDDILNNKEVVFTHTQAEAPFHLQTLLHR